MLCGLKMVGTAGFSILNVLLRLFEPATNKSGACRDTGLRHVPMAVLN